MRHDDLLGSLDGTRPPAGPDAPAGTGRPSSGTGAAGPTRRECSRKGCRSEAIWRLEWNNPRIHAPERRKTWLACPEHRDWLADYLRSRGLLKDVLPLDADRSPGPTAEGDA
ncbi:hypothetical protein [Citricoccus sp. I39-566]|uniref:hypothetical protein n=1 Tax=Citricoccus sp. I39-566 TaxID=3073268 RepID=UPI00286A6B16|nr:hypothetical protein [Citricoccus sp. I39-566]WMY77324.1 hypothetical protein RE421_10740 [Citricoccus sp. I39-566]